ncbi:MAG: hypothetical protein RL722_1714, partial [Pseudomonadota bacterium]
MAEYVTVKAPQGSHVQNPADPQHGYVDRWARPQVFSG